MKLSKILAGASLAALMAGNAHALDLTIGDADNSATVGFISVPVALAEESIYVAPAPELTNTYELTVTTTGTLAAGQNLLLTVDVLNGSFAQDLDGNEVTDGTFPVSGASVQFDGGVATGQEDSSTVTYLIAGDNISGGNNFGVELPVAYDGCDAELGFSITLRTEQGTLIEEGTVGLAGGAVRCFNAYQASVVDDRTVGGGNSFLTSVSSFAAYDSTVAANPTDATAAAPTVSALDAGTSGALGVARVAFNPDNETRPLLDRLDAAGIAAPLTGVEALNLGFDVDISDDSGILFATLDEGAQTNGFTGLSSALVVAVPALTTDDYVDNVTIDVDGTTQVLPQVPAASDVTLSFNDADLILSEAGIGGNLDDLNYEGVVCGIFDWVGDEASVTTQVFRATGFGNQVSLIQATIFNAKDVSFTDGTTVDLPVGNYSGNEIIVTNRMIGAAMGAFGRGDFQLNFVGSEQSLDCDRLQVSPTSAAISDFGNEVTIDDIFIGTPGTEDGDDG